MIDFLHYPLAFLAVVGLLVVAHELGHYLMARWLGVKVLCFSLGFGKVLWSRRCGADQTEWVLAAIPLGGFVKMLDESEGEVPEHELHRSFSRQSLGRRSLIVLAGPLANFVLAIAIYWGLFWHGMEAPRPVLAKPPVATPAAAAGIVGEELVLRVGGKDVQTWQDVHWEILRLAVDRAPIELTVINPRNELSYPKLDTAVLADSGWENDAFARLGLGLYRPRIPAIVGALTRDGVAERAGLRPGDQILAIAGRPITGWGEVVERVRAAPGTPLAFEVQRDQAVLRLSVTPQVAEDKGQTIGRIGAGVADFTVERERFIIRVARAPLPALGKALEETWDKSIFSLRMIGKMVTGELSWRNVSGPVTIADFAGQSARRGVEQFLQFVALISLSLGVLNLLPIPVLDGGHLLYHVAEFVRRKPLPERAMEFGQQIGLALLVALMMLALYNDFNRLFSG